MRCLGRWVTAAAAVVLTGYFLYVAAGALRDFNARALLSSELLAATAMLTFCYGFIIPLSGWAWARLLESLGERHHVTRLIGILAVSQFAKYLPGNVAHVASRAALAVVQGMTGRTLTVSLTVETILVILASVMIGALAFSFSPHQPKFAWTEQLPWGAAALAGGILLLLVVFSLAWRKTARVGRILENRRWPDGGGKHVAAAFGAYSINYLLIGLGLWLLARSLQPGIQVDYWYLTGSFAFSWFAGFITPGAPAGLGVREGAMMLLLTGLGQPDTLLVLTAATRMATLTADALWFGAGLWYLRRNKTRG